MGVVRKKIFQRHLMDRMSEKAEREKVIFPGKYSAEILEIFSHDVSE